MRYLFTGDRHFHPIYDRAIDTIILKFHEGDEILVGDCPTGVDKIVREAYEFHRLKKKGISLHVEKADWKEHGKAAGPIRNQKMIDRKPDYVIALHVDLESSKGTKDCAKRAEKENLKVVYPIKRVEEPSNA